MAVLFSNSIFWLLKSPKELSRWARNPAKGNFTFIHNLSVLTVSSEKGTRPNMSKSAEMGGGVGRGRVCVHERACTLSVKASFCQGVKQEKAGCAPPGSCKSLEISLRGLV